jgi:hypothetical protein
MNRWLVALFLIVVAGCGVKPPIEGREDPFTPAQVHFASEDLRTHTAVGEPKVSRDAAGILFVTVPIRAATDQQLHVDYRATFFDENRQVLDHTGWTTKTLAPNTPDSVQVNSTGTRARYFQVDFRYAR